MRSQQIVEKIGSITAENILVRSSESIIVEKKLSYKRMLRPHHIEGDTDPPVSKTMQYKKITKPLLERKRRARINACLDELKVITFKLLG